MSLNQSSTIQQLVQYAWMGLASSFSPLVILSLHSTYINKYGAYASIVAGGSVSTLWSVCGKEAFFILSGLNIPPAVPGFIVSMFIAYVMSWITKEKLFIYRK